MEFGEVELHEELSMIIYSQDGERTMLLALAPKLPWSRARSVAPRNGETKEKPSLRSGLVFKKKRLLLVFFSCKPILNEINDGAGKGSFSSSLCGTGFQNAQPEAENGVGFGA
jgi:hypothetical protein